MKIKINPHGNHVTMAGCEVIISVMVTGQKMKLSTEDFFSKCGQNPSNCCTSIPRAETCKQKKELLELEDHKVHYSS